MNFLTKLATKYLRKKGFTAGWMTGQRFDLFGTGATSNIKKYEVNNTVYSVVNRVLQGMLRADFKLLNGEGEEIEKHPLLDLLKRPNELQNKRRFFEQYHGYKKLLGEVFVWKVMPKRGSNAGVPKKLWVIPPPLVEKIDINNAGFPVTYHIRTSGSRLTPFPSEQIIHDKSWNPSVDKHRGLSPLTPGDRSVSRDSDASLAAVKMLENSGPPGILTLEDNEVEFGPDQADYVKKDYKEKYINPHNPDYGVPIITAAKMKWEQIGMSAVDMQLIESQKTTLRDICNLYNVPSMLMNDSEATTYNNVHEAKKSLIQDAVIPSWESTLSQLDIDLVKHFEKDQDLNLVLDTSSYQELQEDLKKQADALKSLWQLTPNQVLEMLGKPQSSDPAMDEVYMPQNLIPLNGGMDDEQGLSNGNV